MSIENGDKIDSLRSHFDKIMMWAGGLIFLVVSGFAGWEYTQERRISETATIAAENKRAKEQAEIERQEIRATAAKANRETGELAAALQGQRELLERIDRRLENVARSINGQK